MTEISCATWGPARFLPVSGSAMAPTLCHGDLVAVAMVDRWGGPGLYLLDAGIGPSIVRCESDHAGGIVARHDNPAFGGWSMTPAQFAESVRGQVAAVCHVLDHRLLGL